MKIFLTAMAAAGLLVAQTYAQAQTLTLKGKVTTAGKPVEGAAVYLNKNADSIPLLTTASSAEGSYIFKHIKPGRYHIVVNIVGYETFTGSMFLLSADTTLANIAVVQKTSSLQNVAVVSKRPMVEHLIDRTVVNVDAMLSATGGSVLDALEKSPGVTVEQDGGITLQGKSGVTVYIDDRPTYLSGEDLANYLRSLPASTIDRIELMPNPPAKYDAAGNSGIINIRTKRIRDKGFNGSLNLAGVQGQDTRTNNSINLNYRYNKLNVSASFGYGWNRNFNDVTLNRYFDPTVITNISPDFTQTSYTGRQSSSYNARVGVDFYATAKTTVGMVLTGLLNNSNSHTASTSLLSNQQNQLDSTITANNQDSRTFKNGGINLNYRHDYDKKGTEHSIDVDYITYSTQFNQQFINNSYYPNGKLYDSTLQTGDIPSTIHIFSAKSDFSKPLANGATLSTGIKTSYTQTDNIADYFDILNGSSLPDYNETNHFIYKENINAAYVNANKNFKKLSLQAGLRFENTNANGNQLGNAVKPDSIFSRNYNGLFPTFYAAYKLDTVDNKQLRLNYSRRLDRPYYASLNPFLSPTDKFTFNAGNPFLLPTYSNNVQLTYDSKHFGTTLYYQYIKNKIDGLVQIVDGYYYSRPGNLGSTYVAGIEVEADIDPAKWFNFYFYGRVMDQRTVSNFYTGTLDTKGTNYYVRPVLTFKPAKGWTIQIDGFYRSKLATEQFVDARRRTVNAAVSKKVNDKLTVKLVVNDIFYTLDNSWTIGDLAGTLGANYRNVNDSRNAVLSVTYRFGKTISNLRKHEANGAQSEKERAGN